MSMAEAAPMIVMVTGIVTTGAVLILRPLTKRVGTLLDAMTRERLRAAASDPNESVRIRELLSSIDGRLTLLEERQDFAEALMSAGDTKLLSIQSAQHAQDRN